MWDRFIWRRAIKKRLKKLGFCRQEIRHIMRDIGRSHYYRACSDCSHCHQQVFGRYRDGNEEPLGSAAIIGKKTKIHEGFFCTNCGMEMECLGIVIGKPIDDNDFWQLQHGAWFGGLSLQTRKDEQARNFFDLLRQEAQLPEVNELAILVGEREQLIWHLREVEEKIAALKGAEDVLDELRATEEPVQPQLAAEN